MWYKDWFADERYLALYRHRNDADAEQLLDLVERTVNPSKAFRILDLACGAGRHSIALAKRGYGRVSGLDLSATLIAKARQSAEAEGVQVLFVESDMRTFGGEYDLILNLFTSFGYFEEDSDNQAVIARVGSALVAGGWFVIDFFNAEYVRRTLVAHSSHTLETGETVDEERQIVGNRVTKRIRIETPECHKEYLESVRLFDRAELTEMIRGAGMEPVHVFGSYLADPFEVERSSRCIIFAKKK